MTTKRHDFKANPLSVSTLINLSEWVENMEDTIVANSVLKRAETTKSTEAQIKAASDSILKIETDIKSRQDIEIVLATLRSAEDKAKLALLRPMKVLNESLKMAKETLNTVENKQIDEHKRLRAVEEWVYEVCNVVQSNWGQIQIE